MKFDRLVAHCRQILGNADKLRCFLCDRLAIDAQNFAEHLQSAHVKSESNECHVCGHCGYCFFSRQDLACHAKVWCKKKAEEDKTKIAFFKALDITSSHIPEKVHKCLICPYVSLSERGLLQHMSKAHSFYPSSPLIQQKVKTRFCPQCGEVFSFLEEFVEHKKVCDQQLECHPVKNSPPRKKISKTYRNKSNNQGKKNSSGKKRAKKPKPQCPRCLVEFKTKKALNVHKRSCLKITSL